MKILITGSDKVYAIENFYVKYLREAGVEVAHFPAQTYFYDFYQKSLLHKIIFKSGLSGVTSKINRGLKARITDFKPDVLWVFKGMEILPSTLQWAKDKHIKLVNYNGDSPFIFSGKGSGNQHVTRSIRLFDLHLTYNTVVKQEMESIYHIPTGILPFGFNIDEELLQKCMQQPEIVKACFLGNPDQYRGAFLDKLAAAGVALDVYGNHWGKFVKHANITVHEPVYGDDFWLTLNRYRVQLNLMRPHNPDTHNMRTFELPGVGGIQLAPATADHANFFEEGKEIFLYKNLDQCVTQVKKILAMPVGLAGEIRRNARARCLASGYTYKDRAAQALSQINQLLG